MFGSGDETENKEEGDGSEEVLKKQAQQLKQKRSVSRQIKSVSRARDKPNLDVVLDYTSPVVGRETSTTKSKTQKFRQSSTKMKVHH